MEVGYEERGLDVEIKMSTGLGGTGYTNANFSFRPDITVCPFKEREDSLHFNDKEWEKLEDSNWIIFEAETNPSNLFKNILKLSAYEKIKDNHNFGRKTYSFVLVTFDVYKKLIEKRGIAPFDEVWLFDREGKNQLPEIMKGLNKDV